MSLPRICFRPVLYSKPPPFFATFIAPLCPSRSRFLIFHKCATAPMCAVAHRAPLPSSSSRHLACSVRTSFPSTPDFPLLPAAHSSQASRVGCGSLSVYSKYQVKLWRPRSRLYQRYRFLQLNTNFAAFLKIYKIITLLHRSKFKILACIFFSFFEFEFCSQTLTTTLKFTD